MPSETALAALDQLWGVLEPLGYPLAVMGGISLASWNRLRATQDVDLLIAVDKSSLDVIVETLRSHNCRPKRIPPIVQVGENCFAQFLYTPPEQFYEVQFDLMLAETELQKSAIMRRVPGHLPGIERSIDVLNVEDLILFKLIAGRIIDRADASMVLRENRDAVDFGYLEKWVREMKMQAEYAEIWGEAFPGEPPPDRA